MTESVFSRIFSYRQRENHSPTENFLTEIFSFCLESDEIFRKDFFNLLLIPTASNEKIKISTQESYNDYGRPDIEINFGDTVILIECKVESSERINQLNDYASILVNKKREPKKILIFITKYYEHKELLIPNVNLKLFRWFNVYELINKNHNEITNQLKLYLKEQEMENVKNFTIQDMLALKYIPETISKMEEILEQLRPEFEKEFGSYSREKALDNCYDGYSTLKHESNLYYLAVGFTWGMDDFEIPCFGLWFNIPKKKFENSDLVKILNKELIQGKGWLLEDGEVNPYLMKPITDFLNQKEDCIPAMKKFVEQNLKSIYEVREKYPQLLKK